MKKYSVYWEVDIEDREDFGTCDSAEFDTLDECREWLGFRLNHWAYYCMAFNNETGQVALIGWLP